MIFQIELEFFGFASSVFCYLMKQFFSAERQRDNQFGREDIHKCKHVLPFKFDAFLKTSTDSASKKQRVEQRDKRKSKSQAKRDWRNKIDCWRVFRWKETKKQMQRTSQCLEWKAESNQIANEREKRCQQAKNWVMKDCLSRVIICRKSQEIAEWQFGDKMGMEMKENKKISVLSRFLLRSKQQ